MKAKLMTEISAKEFGKLQSDVVYLKDQSDKQDGKLDKLGEKLDRSMSAEDLQRFLEPIITNQATHTKQISDHETRLASLEDLEKLRKASVWRKVGVAAEGNFIKWVAGGIFIALLVLAYISIRQSQEIPVQFIEKTVEVKK